MLSRYGVAIAALALSFLFKVLVDRLIVQETPFLLVFAAVMVAAWYGGFGPGLFTTVLAALVTDYFFLTPTGSFSGFSLEGLPLFVFLLEGVLVSALVAELRYTRWQAEEKTREAQAHQASLKRSEERFRLLIEGVRDYAIFMLDTEGRVASWNVGAQRTTGYGAEEVLGNHFSIFFTPEDVRLGKPEQELEVAVAEGRVEEEDWRLRKDGQKFWANVTVNTLRDESGNARGFSKIVRDITERKRAEESLRQSLDALLALYETGQLLSSSLEREEIGTRLLEILQRVSRLDAAVITLQDKKGCLREWRTVGPEALLSSIRNTPEAEAGRRAVMEAGKSRSFEIPGQKAESFSITALHAPLRVRNRNCGVLEAYGSESLQGGEAMETLTSLASQAASALENARLYEELAERERQLQHLVKRMLTAQEEEQRRVAYEVHDGLTQMVVAAYQYLQDFSETYPPPSEEAKRELNETTELVRRTVGEARRVIANLRPTVLDDLGLAAALRQQVSELRSEPRRVEYSETLGEERLPPEVEITLFRIAQEALTNVRKHAGKDAPVRISLEREGGRVRLAIEDRGRGFEPQRFESNNGPGERVGLSSMRERTTLLGGELVIRSEPGAGTSVSAELPATTEEEDENDAG